MALFGRKPEETAAGLPPSVGIPGVQRDESVAPEMAAMLLNRDSTQKTIGREDIKRATELLAKYKQGKANLETRIVDDELWWELRHWEAIGRNKLRDNETQVTPTSAWLFIRPWGTRSRKWRRVLSQWRTRPLR